MSLDTVDKIQYRDALTPEGIRFQSSPPVCNICEQQITRQNFGWACVEIEGHTGELFERIECTACTTIRDSGAPLLTFLQRHRL
jgi:hypothetical protein